MRNEILEELWKSKDEIAAENENDIKSLIKKLKEGEERDKNRIVDFSSPEKETV